MATQQKNSSKLLRKGGYLMLRKLVNPSFGISYRLPLTKEIVNWHTDSLETLVRKYAQLTLSNVHINDVLIKWEDIENE